MGDIYCDTADLGRIELELMSNGLRFTADRHNDRWLIRVTGY